MLARVGARLSYANVIATLALFVALGGTGYAVSQLSGKRIEKRTIRGNRLKKDTVGGTEVAEAKLGQVPSAKQADAATNSTLFGGESPAGFARYGRSIPASTTVTGEFGAYNLEQDQGASPAAADFHVVSLPAPAPVGLTDGQVNFDAANPTLTADEDPTCNGSPADPTAPPGKVCIYPSTILAAPNVVAGFAVDASRYGFAIQTSAVAGPSSSSTQVQGTWAYTAP